MDNDTLEGGVLGEAYSESDWRVGGVIDWADIGYPKNKHSGIQYNQKAIPDGQNDCTIVSSMGCYSDLTGYIFTTEEHKKIHNLAVDQGLDPKKGRWLHKAIDLVRKYTKGQEHMITISSISVKLDSEDFWEALSRGFSVQVGYGGNSTYNRDRDDDGDMGLVNWGKASYYHAVRRVGENIIVDNYVGLRKTNIYTVSEFKKIVETTSNFFSQGYFYFNKYLFTMTDLPLHISREVYPERDQKILAREQEVSKWIKEGGNKDALYRDYTSEGSVAMMQMMIDVKMIRLGLM